MNTGTHLKLGQALVETALVLPLVLLLIFGIISYGLYINAADTIQQAARVGARTATIGDTLGCPGDSAETQLANGQSPTVYGIVDNQINNDSPWLTSGSGTSAKPLITYAAVIGNPSNAQENDILVTVAYPYHPILPIPGLLPSEIEIAQTYQMMVQTMPPYSSTMPSGETAPMDPTPTPNGQQCLLPYPTRGMPRVIAINASSSGEQAVTRLDGGMYSARHSYSLSSFTQSLLPIGTP